MSRSRTWIFRFLVIGLGTDDATRMDLREELTELLREGLVDLNVVPVNRAVQIDIEMTPLDRYDAEAFEAYLIDHILTPVARKLGAEPDITPLRARSRR